MTGTAVALLFVAIATAGEVRFSEGAPSSGGDTGVDESVTTVAPMTPDARPGDNAPRWEIPEWVGELVRIVLFVSLAIVAVLVLLHAWRHRPTIRWPRRRRRRSDDFEVLDDVASSIAADAAAQRAALRSGTPRNAIVACWLRLEAAVLAAGVTPHPADTSTEFVERVLTGFRVEPDAIMRLGALYREARFSEHPIGEDARHDAISALDTVHAGLREAAVPAVAGS